VIVEKFVTGHDYRLLCVAGEFAAAVKREPAAVTGDGRSTIAELIDRENATPERADTPTSPLGKIITDDSMENFLREQKLGVDSVLDDGEEIYLRKVANLSAGGVSENVTDIMHPDNVALCRTIAQQFRLTCMGIDVLTDDIGRSWTEGNFGIIEINAAPGIFMHLNPAKGSPIDVPSRIIETFYTSGNDARIPIFTFNQLSRAELRRILDFILNLDLTLNPGGACHEAIFVRRDELPLMPDHNSNVRNLLRNPKLDVMVAESPETVYAQEGLYYSGSNLVVLQEPSDVERTLALSVLDGGVVMVREGLEVVIKRGEQMETQTLTMADEFTSLYLREIKSLCER
jgi:cyanophycin synthetase